MRHRPSRAGAAATRRRHRARTENPNTIPPARPPQHLPPVPAGPRKKSFELLDHRAVAAHGPVEPLQVAVDDEDEIVEALACGEPEPRERFGLVHFAIADECPDLAAAMFRTVEYSAVGQVGHETRLVDRLDRPQA